MKIKGTTSRFEVGSKVWVQYDWKLEPGEVKKVYTARLETIDEETKTYRIVFGYEVVPSEDKWTSTKRFEENEVYASLSELIEKRYGCEKLEKALLTACFDILQK